ncbi:MAG TPA: signal recognition particle subunit SRP19/SEC65 family protein [Methanotrichaceae archaeon]|nr:signal recognition particle subunit SRP19/SEC65 family protein [Methanotrichaceae archaeon]
MPGKSDKVVIWPIYFDSSKTRSEGRAVSSKDAVKEPNLDKLLNAARRAGLKSEVEREKKHPSQWADSSGRLLVVKTEPKSAILKKISRGLKKS